MWSPPDALAHAIPVRHSESAEPAITLALVLVGVFAAVLVGMLAARRLADTRWLPAANALAFGALLFLLYDLLKETASLGQGLVTRPGLQAGLVLAFALGLLALARFGDAGASGRRLAWAWALGIAAHGMGEAWIVGTEAYSTAIAEPTQATSFLLHKAIEGFTIPLVAALARPTMRTALSISGVLAALALAGGLGGFWLGPGTMPGILFAVGAGATSFAVWVLARRAPPTLAHAAWAAAGVALIYAAGLLHQF